MREVLIAIKFHAPPRTRRANGLTMNWTKPRRMCDAERYQRDIREVVFVRRLFVIVLALLFVAPQLGQNVGASPLERAVREQDNQGRRVMRVPDNGRRRRVRGEFRRRRGRGIKSAFARAGRGAGRGGKRFGQNMARGRPVRAGKELGKGMGTFGKHTGKGVARSVRRAVTP
ncbi:MAG TPA: hypothetical protein VIW80_10680 [Pyrinomonadaceae bacterium]|jgi:hypothetical protein